MGRSLGRECNFEKVCFELGTEYWQRRRVSGIRREWIPESWTNDRESPFAKWWSDIWNGKNKWIRRSCRNSMWRKWKTIVKICRLLICECFVCEKTEFVIDSLFDWKRIVLAAAYRWFVDCLFVDSTSLKYSRWTQLMRVVRLYASNGGVHVTQTSWFALHLPTWHYHVTLPTWPY